MDATLSAPQTVSCKNRLSDKAAAIYEYTHISASSLLSACELAHASRGSPRGITSDQEQDLLRAMLVMACAGLDATLKQLIKDSLPELAKTNTSVRKGFEEFIARKLKGEESGTSGNYGTKFLAKTLASSSPRKHLVSEYIYDLTGDSLQSHGQVLKVAQAFGISKEELGINVESLKIIFDLRNKIIHELDINIDATGRKRNIRRKEDMLVDTDEIMKIARKFVIRVDKLFPESV